MAIWFSGDQHLGHFNIIEYCRRPWATADEMDEALISAWNKYVQPDDVVYQLGDFTLSGKSDAKRYFMRLNGHIHVLGNPWHHDRRWIPKEFDVFCYDYVTHTNLEPYFVYIEPPVVVLEKVEKNEDGRGVPTVLCHYAFEIWERRHHGALHFHGHSHGMLPHIPNRLDVGVDNAFKLTNEYRPLSLEEAVKFAKE